MKEQYFLSDVSGEATLGMNYGQVFLSRIEPNILYLYRFSEMKSILIPLFLVKLDNCIIKEKLAIPVIHFSSDKNSNAKEKRIRQIKQLFSEMNELNVDHTIVVGDFNFSDGNPEEELLYKWGKDAWKETHDLKKHPGYTFDPLNNFCAAITTRKGMPLRLDRIVFKSDSFNPVKASIMGKDSIKLFDLKKQRLVPLHPSDYFALICEFEARKQIDGLDTFEKNSDTILAIVPPKHIWKQIQRIQKNSSEVKLLQLHIKIIHPFFGENVLGNILALIEKQMTKVEPFIINLNNFSYLEEYGVVYLEPLTQSFHNYELLYLHETLVKLFPSCVDSENNANNEYIPRLDGAENIMNNEMCVAKLQQSWEPLEFLVDHIYT